VAVFLEEFGDRRRLLPEAVFVSRGNYDRERRTDRDAPGHERGAAGGAARLAVPAGEDGSLLGYAIDIRCRMAEAGASARIATEIIPSSVVGHKHDDVGSHIKPHELHPAVQRLAFWRVVAGDRLLLPHSQGF